MAVREIGIDEGYKRLGMAIVVRALRDWDRLCALSASPADGLRGQELQTFFHSEWFRCICKATGLDAGALMYHWAYWKEYYSDTWPDTDPAGEIPYKPQNKFIDGSIGCPARPKTRGTISRAEWMRQKCKPTDSANAV